VNLESLKSLVSGGIAFATSEDPTNVPVKDGTIFPLHDKPQKEWLNWMPRVRLPEGGQGPPRGGQGPPR
jgi:hypothetical protein